MEQCGDRVYCKIQFSLTPSQTEVLLPVIILENAVNVVRLNIHFIFLFDGYHVKQFIEIPVILGQMYLKILNVRDFGLSTWDRVRTETWDVNIEN